MNATIIDKVAHPGFCGSPRMFDYFTVKTEYGQTEIPCSDFPRGSQVGDQVQLDYVAVGSDRRFVSQAWIDYYQEGNPKGHWAPVYSYRWKRNNTGMRDNGRLRLRLKRLVDSFRVDAPWLMRLEKAYCQETLRDGYICPHRGISCRGVVAESDGVVCPGHGLKWNTETGKLVSRIGQTFQRSFPKL